MKKAIIYRLRQLPLFVLSIFVLLILCAKPIDRYGMAVIKAAGEKFTMGQKGLANAGPIEVTLERDYAIDRTEITAGFFTRIMGYTPSFFKGDTCKPVENVDFTEAALFCNKRSGKEGLTPCYNPNNWSCDCSKNGFRLPNEAEWEYACRAGTTTPFFWGKKDPSKYCWYSGNSE